MLSTIFRNLIANAVKFTSSEGLIKIETIRKNDHFEISVLDNGIGMTKDYMNSLFKLDVKQSSTGTGGEMGTGLGLVLCDFFSKKRRGKIIV